MHNEGKLHVLAVDDEKPLAGMLARQLDKLGFSVSSYHSSLEALSAYKQNPGKFDLLITDNTMPKLTGVELVKTIKAINPKLPVIFLSGHLTEDKLKELNDMEATLALPKPYSLQELSAALKSLTEEKQNPEDPKL